MRLRNKSEFRQAIKFNCFSTISCKQWARSGKHMSVSELKGDQRRQLVDTQQVFDAWRETAHESKRRLAGSMRWGERNGVEYLLRKNGRSETSLGRPSAHTEHSC